MSKISEMSKIKVLIQKISNINTAQKSRMIWINNLQTRLVQFKDQKKLKTYLIVTIELSLNKNELNGSKYK